MKLLLVNRNDREDTQTTDSQHGDYICHFPSHSDSNQHSENSDEIPRADHEIYCSQLLTKKRGFPLWVPGPGRQLPIEYRRQGISIGDVGIFTPTGVFDFLFNIFQPANHPINRGIVPQDFVSLSFEEVVDEILENEVYGPGSYLASSSVRRVGMNWIRQVLFHDVLLKFNQSSNASETSSDQRFESTAKEAAILIMPDGATTKDLRNTRRLRYAISSNAKDWYTYARDTRGRDVRNGEIRVVVGVDKVSSWGIATSTCNTGQTASFVFKPDSGQFYRWDCVGGSGRVSPQPREIIEDNVVPQNQCVFVRTINFTLSGKMWNNPPSETVEQLGPGSGNFGNRYSTSSNRGSRGGHGRSASGNQSSGYQAASMQESLQWNQSVNFDPVEVGVSRPKSYSLTSHMNTIQVNHPAAALHNYLHEKVTDVCASKSSSSR